MGPTLSRRGLLGLAAAGLVVGAVGCSTGGDDNNDLSGRKKLVFAHYFTPYPLSFDNLPADRDQYALDYLRTEGEEGKHAYSSGFLRDRPLPRPHLGQRDWKYQDLKTEIQTAKDAGIDGFALIVLNDEGFNWEQINLLLQAADEIGDFPVMLQPDMSTLAKTGNDPSRLAAVFENLNKYRSVYRVDGKVVVCPFKADHETVDWWRECMAESERRGVPISFWAQLLDPSGGGAESNVQRFAPISDVIGEWGAKDPEDIAPRLRFVDEAHELGKGWIMPITPQDYRPYTGDYNEARNTEMLRRSWEAAIEKDAEYAMLITWNDYSEATGFAPSVTKGNCLLEINKYYMTRYQTGKYPKITEDVLYLSHRTQWTDAQPPQELLAKVRGATPPTNNIEVLAMLTEPAQIRISAGSQVSTFDVPAGVSVSTAPLREGSIEASAWRGDKKIALALSPFRVDGTPDRQDLTYHFVRS